jgi:hypothetical protein
MKCLRFEFLRTLVGAVGAKGIICVGGLLIWLTQSIFAMKFGGKPSTVH